MEIILIAAFRTIALLVAHRVGEIGPDRVRSEAWKSAAAACRIECVATKDHPSARDLEGARGTLSVRLHSLTGTVSGRAGTRITVTGLSPGLSIAPVGERGNAVRVGDKDFDRAMQVRGDPLESQALLDAETRAHLQALFSTRDGLGSDHRLVSIGGGTLVVDCWDSPIRTRSGRVAVALEDALTLAQRLVTPTAIEERLRAVFRSDPVRGVRLRALKMLAYERPGHPATIAAARAALESDDEEIRLVGAIAAGPEGLATLRLMAGAPAMADDLSAQVITALRDDLDVTKIQETFSEAVASWRSATAVACFEALCHRGVAHAVFASTVLGTLPRAIVLPVVRALGLSGSSDGEPALLGTLTHSDIDVRLAAIDSLGRIGTADAVPALRHVERQVSTEGEQVRAVNAAIASIQSRLLGADPGQLALTQAAGELSLAEGPGGRLSIRGRRSE